MFNGLDTFGQNTKTTGLRKRNHSTEEFATLIVLIEETSINLYDVARQPLKVTEICVAGAKIIDPQFDTEILQAEQRVLNGGRPFKEQAFRQFKNQSLRSKTGIAKNAGDRRYKGRLT